MTADTTKSSRTTFCRICEAFCGLVADVEGNTVVKIRGDRDHPVTRGYVCPKGVAIGRVTNDPDRVTTPLRRVGGPGEFEPVSWDEAMADIAERLNVLRRDHGPESLALYGGNPAAFNFAHSTSAPRFLAKYGSPHIYGPGSQDTFGRQVASWHLYGSVLEWPFPDIPRSDFVLLLGTNPLVSHGSLLTLPRIADELRAVVGRGGRVVVIDPARTKTAKAFEHIAVRPATDAWLLAALLYVVFDEGLAAAGLDDQADGVAELHDAVRAFTPERAAAVTGVDADVIRRLGRELRRG